MFKNYFRNCIVQCYKMTIKSKIAYCLLFSMAVSLYSIAQIKTASGKIIANEDLQKFLKREMDSLGMPGLSLAIINDRKIVYHAALGMADIDSNKKVDDQTMFEAASLSKPVFACFVMKLVEKGLINLDKPLYKYLPNPDIDYDPRYKLITARMVLCHTTGLPNWRSDNKGVVLNIHFTPGTQYSYSGEAYEYLANVVAHITHTGLKSLGNLFTKEIGAPMGLEHFYFTWNDYLATHKARGYYGKNGMGIWQPDIFRAASSLHTESINYAKFLIGIMDETILKKQSIDEMLKEQIVIPNDSKNSHDAFGLGFYIEQTKYGTRYSHNGSNGDFTSGFIMYPDQKSGYVFFTNCDKGGDFNKKLKAFLTEGNLPN